MFKRIICIGIMVVIVLSFVGCNEDKDNFNLEGYKEMNIIELQVYAREKGEEAEYYA